MITGFYMFIAKGCRHVQRGPSPPAGAVRPRESSRGAALLELAIVVPLLVFVCIWVGSLGFAISRLVWLSEASYAAVVAGAEDPSSSASIAENVVDELFTQRHNSESGLVLQARAATLITEGSGDSATSVEQAPLISLSVELASNPLFGFLPVIDLGLTTVISRLTVGRATDDLSQSSNIPGYCDEGWQLPCGTCGTPCAPGSIGGNGQAGIGELNTPGRIEMHNPTDHDPYGNDVDVG